MKYLITSLRELPMLLRLLFVVSVGMFIYTLLHQYAPNVSRYAFWPLMGFVSVATWFFNRRTAESAKK